MPMLWPIGKDEDLCNRATEEIAEERRIHPCELGNARMPDDAGGTRPADPPIEERRCPLLRAGVMGCGCRRDLVTHEANRRQSTQARHRGGRKGRGVRAR
jgi:hypothetical protein